MNIGDYLDLEKSKDYVCSDGSVTSTIDVDALVEAVRAEAMKAVGNWLETHCSKLGDVRLVTYNNLMALKRGDAL